MTLRSSNNHTNRSRTQSGSNNNRRRRETDTVQLGHNLKYTLTNVATGPAATVCRQDQHRIGFEILQQLNIRFSTHGNKKQWLPDQASQANIRRNQLRGSVADSETNRSGNYDSGTKTADSETTIQKPRWPIQQLRFRNQTGRFRNPDSETKPGDSATTIQKPKEPIQ